MEKTYIPRNINLDLTKSILILGPRRTGKTMFIQKQLKPDLSYDLLNSKDFLRLSVRPYIIEEEIKENHKIVVIDEIQKLPVLMDEIHRLIETKRNVKFILTGSNARKLKKTHTSLMAGRAKLAHFHPFTYYELKKANIFNLKKVLTYGTIPDMYLSSNPYDELTNYIMLYLKEEIISEAIVRNIENFSRFLNVAGASNAELVNFTQVGEDSWVKPRTVIEYFNILQDTLIGNIVEPYRARTDRKVYSRAKFYFFDIGVANALCERKEVTEKSVEFGKNFEHFIFNELNAYKDYTGKISIINFWRDYNGNEVDFIINGEIAIEVKAKEMVYERDLKGLKSFLNSHKVKKSIVVSMEPRARKHNDIEILPYNTFLEMLWSNELV
ncbi:MAG: AAA family ATPase [Thermoplasmata archaeon]